MDEAKARIRAALDKWLKPLGLLWWKVDVIYFDDPTVLAERFYKGDGDWVLARMYADWRYMTARIEINLPQFVDLDQEKTERTIVHELCHALVNEMQWDGMDHEERVVSTLTYAFFWVWEEGERSAQPPIFVED
jgi:hypothetical protein